VWTGLEPAQKKKFSFFGEKQNKKLNLEKD